MKNVNFALNLAQPTYNNINHNPDRKFGPSKTIFYNCIVCGEQLDSERKYCQFHAKSKSFNPDITLKELKSSYEFKANRFAKIRSSARSLANTLGMLDSCLLCGYGKIVEVCHIRHISSFPDSATYGEVNSPTNLIGLCPNHHWELDHQKLSDGDLDLIINYTKQFDGIKINWYIGKKPNIIK